MTSPFRKAMVWLGLGPDEEYEALAYDDVERADEGYRPVAGQPSAGAGRTETPGPEPAAARPPLRARRRDGDGGQAARPEPRNGSVRTLASARPAASEAPAEAAQPLRPAPVRTMRPTSARAYLLTPAGFEDAQEIGDRFKAGQPVAADLGQAERDLARRLIDFASGLCYGLGGRMERVAGQVYLLTPANVQVPDEDRRRLAERAGG